MKNARLYLLVAACLLTLPAHASNTAAAQADKVSTAASATPANTLGDTIPALPAAKSKTAPVNDEDRIAREVRHELVMQPYYTIWDWLAFRVNGNTVELVGDVINGSLKSDSVNAVKRIEGVEKVIDHINLLSISSEDERIRRQAARRIFSWGSLSRYSWEAVPSIHIIVSRGRIRLEGVVNSKQDKDAAFMMANQVPGVFQVTNNLRVVKD